MTASESAPPRDPRPPTAAEVVGLLEVLWERGREAGCPPPASSSQLRVLYALDRDEGVNLRTLAESLGSAPSSVSRLCDRLQALGFVSRTPSPASRRELQLRLTGRGETYLRDVRTRREELLLTTIAAMPPTAREAFAEGLESFAAAAGATAPLRRDGSADPAARSA